MAAFGLDGLGDLGKAFDSVKKSVEGMTGNLPIQDILTDDFVQKHTQFQNISELAEKSGLDLSNLGSLENLPTDKLDSLVKEYSNFDSWQTLLKEASENFLKGKR